jgi:spore coat polysaccharide biosynthesis predicted glycosyltransferase SpsG
MFFNKKKFQDEIETLKSQVAALQKEAESKDGTIKALQNQIQNHPKENIDAIKEELVLFNEIAAHSQEEGLVVFDSKHQLFFANNLAKHNIKDYSIVLDAILKESDRLIMDDCEAKVLVKNYKGYKIVSLN